MYVCSSGHDKIVHDNWKGCPLCQKIEELDTMTEQRDKLQEQLNEIENKEAK